MPSASPFLSHETLDDLAQAVWSHREAGPPSKRTLVSISGIPGSGKSTLSCQLAEKLNNLFLKRNHFRDAPGKETGAGPSTATHVDLSNPSPRTFAVDIAMDGYHLSRAQLRALPDPHTAIHRRGAEFTYDATSYCRLVEKLAQPVHETTDTISAPAFDHATKDPVADSIEINKEARIVILEGNYVNLDREPWRTAAKLFDVKLMIMVDRMVARERLVKRHVSSGVCVDETSARSRVESTDDMNAEDILAHQVDGVQEVVMQDHTWRFKHGGGKSG